MDLKNRRITVGELLDDPRSRRVFQRRFGALLNNPLVAAGRSLTLEQLMTLASAKLPQSVIRDTLRELEQA